MFEQFINMKDPNKEKEIQGKDNHNPLGSQLKGFDR